MDIERQMENEYIDGMVAQAKNDQYLADALAMVRELSAALSKARPLNPHYVKHLELLLAVCGTVDIHQQFQVTRAWLRSNPE